MFKTYSEAVHSLVIKIFFVRRHQNKNFLGVLKHGSSTSFFRSLYNKLRTVKNSILSSLSKALYTLSTHPITTMTKSKYYLY